MPIQPSMRCDDCLVNEKEGVAEQKVQNPVTKIVFLVQLVIPFSSVRKMPTSPGGYSS
jgi:hypothetical protein